MDPKEFVEDVKKRLIAGTILNNPKKGTSTVVKYEGDVLIYMRGKTKYRVNLIELAKTYENFKGTTVTTSDLGKYNPNVFGKKGTAHACNRSFFLILMQKIGFTKKISGKGRAGDPFRIQL